ncbi:MAG: AAA family ATPase [Myxococcales bacterium]|nr:AAA family ATPase [Myxococcales bacterium]MDH5307536.1 AAA family ATPase [Myxococcales bacterium]MDH5565817.1 AAA family ATPase [Myxococcales bacterium]
MSSATVEELRALIRSGWRLIALESFEEERAVNLLERVAQACERRCETWSLAAGLGLTEHGEGSLDAGLQAIEACEEPTLFVLLDAHRLLGDAIALRRLRDLLPTLASRRQCIVLLGPVFDLPMELVREAGRVELPLPAAAELRHLFGRVLEQSEMKSDETCLGDAVRGALGLAATEAVRVFRKALRSAGALDANAVAEIVREKRRALRRTPALSFHDDATELADVGGLGELKHWLAERRRAFTDEARHFGLPVPRGLLLLGVQGCGKSLCAKAVAREWQFPLLRLDLASAFGGGAQSPEAAMREATQVAESLAPAVLWIDEIEKGFAATADDPRASRIFGSFLTWLSEKQSSVFVVATANDVTGLPPELLRRGRFDELFFVDLPTPSEREEILAIHLRKRGRDPLQYKLEELALAAERLTGAELEQVVTAALYVAFAESRELAEADLINAIEETVPLYDTYEERIKELRDWARGRARPASLDAKIVDLFAAR